MIITTTDGRDSLKQDWPQASCWHAPGYNCTIAFLKNKQIWGEKREKNLSNQEATLIKFINLQKNYNNVRAFRRKGQ